MLATLPSHAFAAAKPPPPPTVEALATRLQHLEQLLGATSPSGSADADSVAELDQRLRVLERKLELQQEEAATKAASAPVVTVGDKGLSVRSTNSDYEIKLKGLVQADARVFFDDRQLQQTDTFLLRRVRPTIEGSLGPLVGYRLTPEFAGDSASIVDAYLDIRFNPAYTLRAGKYKSPIGLERLQSGGATALVERGFPTELAPNRDIGVELIGELSKGRVNYAIGVSNGTADGRDSTTANADNNFEVAGRIFFEPWKNQASALSGLGFGLAASTGTNEGSGNNFLPRYRTPGQNIFFSYRATVLADGEHQRISPQFYYYRNAFGLMGEYIASKQEIALIGNPSTRASLSNTAWQLTGSWVLTGEDGGYRGVVKPLHPFTADGEGWGAFELVGRYGVLDIDDDAFPVFANPSLAPTLARSWGLGLNWYLNSNLKLVFNVTDTRFDGGAPLGADREAEKTFFSRVQVAF
jgi:phosphate-selective porin OprO/OprP